MTDSDPYGQQPNPYGQPTPYGEPPAAAGQPYGQQPAPYGTQPYGAAYPGSHMPRKRPGTVTAAGLTTIVMSGLVLLVGLLVIGVGLAGTDQMFDDFRSGSGGAYDEFSDSDLGAVLVVIGVVLVIWCAIAMLLGVLVMRRSSVARIVLVISASVSILFSLVSILSIVSVIPLVAAIAVIVLLFTGGANSWFSGRGPTAPPPPAANPWG